MITSIKFIFLNLLKKYAWFTPLFIFSAMLIIVPTVIGLVYAFLGTHFASELVFVLTWKNNILKVIFHSILLGGIATIFCILLGYPFTYALYMLESTRHKSFFIIIVTLPIWLNSLIKVASLKVLIILFGLNIVHSDYLYVIGFVYLYLPFMIIGLYNGLQNIDKNMIATCRDLGKSKISIFFKVILPLNFSGLFTGILLVFLPASTNVTVPYWFNTGNDNLIGTVIVNYFSGGSNEFSTICAIGLVLIFFSCIILLLIKVAFSMNKMNETKLFNIKGRFKWIRRR